MKIAVIGAGNVGGTLALKWAEADHEVIIGARNPGSDKIRKVLSKNGNIKIMSIADAAAKCEVILISAPAGSVNEVAAQLGDVQNKIIIDAMNSVSAKPLPYNSTFEALQNLTNCKNIVKCFNSTGFENMEKPQYGNLAADMFMAGSSIKGKEAASGLSKDCGFAECYDFGGDERVPLLEQLAICWINLSIFQKQGRRIAFKILKEKS